MEVVSLEVTCGDEISTAFFPKCLGWQNRELHNRILHITGNTDNSSIVDFSQVTSRLKRSSEYAKKCG